MKPKTLALTLAVLLASAALSIGFPSAPTDDLSARAAADDPVAHYLLARRFESGVWTPTSRGQMLAHYRRAAELGHTTAQARLGEILLERADQAERDDQRQRLREQAVRLIRHAADAGNGYAQQRLADLYEAGTALPADPSEALRYRRLAAANGQAGAAWTLARHDLDAPPPTVPTPDGIRYLAQAADGGVPAASLELARRYRDGDRLPRDLGKAALWAARAVEQHADGAVPLRDAISAETRLVEQRLAEAKAPTAKAPPTASPVAASDSGVGAGREPAAGAAAPTAPAAGTDTPPDPADAIARLRERLDALATRLAEVERERAGLAARLAQAETSTAEPAKDTIAVPEERRRGLDAVRAHRYAQALRHFEAAADAGDAAALASLGSLYLRGQGVAASVARAIDCYTRAGGLGSDVAWNNLGFLYRHGFGVPVDLGLARRYYERAALRGNAEARQRLAELHGGADAMALARR